MLESSIRKNDVISQIRNLIPGQARASRTQPLDTLCRLFYSEVGCSTLERARPDDLVAAARGLLAFIDDRRPGEDRVRAFNPERPDHGWESAHTIVEVVTEDRPHLVASLSLALQREGVTLHQVVHPVADIERDEHGRLLSIDAGRGVREAILRLEIDRQRDPVRLDALVRTFGAVLEDVRILATDSDAMRQRLDDAISATAIVKLAAGRDSALLEETLDYLRWLRDGRFTFIGYARYSLTCVTQDQCHLALDGDSRLGILRFERHFPADKKQIDLSAYLSGLVMSEEPLILTKSTYRSPVVQAGHLDYLGVKQFDAAGRVIGEHRFFGLYGTCAYSTAASGVPLLRLRIERLRSRLGARDDGYRGRVLQQILAQYPRDEMLQCDAEELEEILRGMLEAHDRPQLRLFTRTDVYGRFVTAMVMVPREKFNASLRRRLQQILLEGLSGSDAEYRICDIDGLLVTIQYRVHTRDAHRLVFDSEALERRLADAMLSWEDRLRAALIERLGEEQGLLLFDRYGEALPAGYCADVCPATAVADVVRLEGLDDDRPLAASLYQGPDTALRFKLYGHGRPLALSSVLPVLENLGVEVTSAHPYALAVRSGAAAWMLDFEFVGEALDPACEALRTRFEEAFVRTCQGQAENDGYNRLVVAAGFNWRQALLFRALGRYLSQIQLPFSQQYLQDALVRNPAIAVLLNALFDARFDPQRASQPFADDLVQQLQQALDAVGSLDEDRILRAFLALIQALLRTNSYQRAADGGHKDYLALKLDPGLIPGIPRPCPKFEIFVYSPRVEGVHLRGGKVARGGLRWSDRREDYRTEVLGLLKAQMVKNAVIVPAGSKGGFYCKRLPEQGSRDEIQSEAVACYRTFIRGLLDLTDNLVDGEVVPPADLVRHDDDDPYLVVAADKGTATFSDIANGLSREYGFWLDDAFASGGAHGYDHKKMGITARGAWESVKRLFLELGRDTQREDFSVVGIGDMSGDVFGNGMLLSPHIRLVAAFNHQHIFIDPTPDARATFAERERLFRLPRSSWADYDSALISPGGGVFSRSAKQIRVSPEMRAALALAPDVSALTPAELIREILKAPVDLLWNGGIGTYVKAGDESHADVGDRANDAVRVNGGELRCRVVGEGGNLGLTQRGRIEFARQGGLMNTDAIDNSGGVDCSDHEVNIKVLMSQAAVQGILDEPERNALLAQMDGDVADLVLRNNYRQAALLSQAAAWAPAALDSCQRLMQGLERAGRLDPALENLPGAQELAARGQRGEGLSRPELAVLTAYGKISLAEQLVEARLADNPWFSARLSEYFPAALAHRLPEMMAAHPLKHEILATCFAGELVNRMGPTFATVMMEEQRCSPVELLAAFVIARDLLGIQALWDAIDALGTRVPYGLQLELLAGIREQLEQACHWLLGSTEILSSVATTCRRLGPGVEAAGLALPARLGDSARERLASQQEALVTQGLAPALAEEYARLPYRLASFDIVRISEISGAGLELSAQAFFEFEQMLDLNWLRQAIRDLPGGDSWQRQARSSLTLELGSLLCELSVARLAVADERGRYGRAQEAVERTLALFGRVREIPVPSFAQLSVAVQALKRLAKPEPAPVRS